MSYETAKATQMLATQCALCGRPLLDAVSVSVGMGPICREKSAMPDTLSEEQRVAANRIVHAVALSQTEDAFTKGARELQALGCSRLADLIYARSLEAKRVPDIIITNESDRIVVKAPFVEIANARWRAIQGRRWDSVRKVNTFPKREKAAVWDVLQFVYPGAIVEGPKGRFTIPGDSPQMAEDIGEVDDHDMDDWYALVGSDY